jgi:hypothetical protein
MPFDANPCRVGPLLSAALVSLVHLSLSGHAFAQGGAGAPDESAASPPGATPVQTKRDAVTESVRAKGVGRGQAAGLAAPGQGNGANGGRPVTIGNRLTVGQRLLARERAGGGQSHSGVEVLLTDERLRERALAFRAATTPRGADEHALERRSRWDEIRAKLGPKHARPLPAAILAELRNHARREARLARIELLTLRAGDQGLTTRASKLRAREQQRHDARIEKLITQIQAADRAATDKETTR